MTRAGLIGAALGFAVWWADLLVRNPRRAVLAALVLPYVPACAHLSHDDKVVIIAATVDGAVCGAVDALISNGIPWGSEKPDAGEPLHSPDGGTW